MIDLHCHLLPGVDDGAPDLEAALEMGRVLSLAGFEWVAASPHYGEGPGGDVPLEVANERRAQLQEALVAHGVTLELLANAEHHVTAELLARIDRRAVVPIGGQGRWLLVEFPWGGLADPEGALFRLQAKGFKLLLAHPERHRFLSDALARRLVERGIRLQVELGSFIEVYGAAARERALRWSKAGLTHVVATDLHRPWDAAIWIKAALAELGEQLGAAARSRGFVDNPRRIIDDANADALDALCDA